MRATRSTFGLDVDFLTQLALDLLGDVYLYRDAAFPDRPSASEFPSVWDRCGGAPTIPLTARCPAPAIAVNYWQGLFGA